MQNFLFNEWPELISTGQYFLKSGRITHFSFFKELSLQTLLWTERGKDMSSETFID